MKSAIESRGGEIRLKSPVARVIIEAGVVKGIEARGGFELFEKVVSTVPLPYIPRVIPDLPTEILRAFSSRRNIAVVCVIAKLRKPVSEYFWLNVNDPDMDIPGVVQYSNLMPLNDHIVYVPFYMPGEHPKYQESDQAFIDKVRRYLKKINADLQDTDFIDWRASRYRFAQPVCEPGYLEHLPSVALPIRGLWAADTSYYYPEDRGISESVAFGRNMVKKFIGNISEH